MTHRASFLVAGALVGAAGALAFSQPILLSSATARTSASNTSRELNLFLTVFDRVRSDYVEKPDDSSLIEGAINGMLSSLDPHSSYLDPRDFREMTVELGGGFGGLGIEVTMENGIVKVVSPIDGTPASKAGILANDLIVAVDAEPLDGMTLDQAVDKMRGPINTPITLTIQRTGVKKPFDVKLVREQIVVQSVSSRAEGDVGYIRITEFGEQTFSGLKVAMGKLSNAIGKDKIKGYVIDLRNDPGGLLDQAVAVSDAFVDRGEIVAIRGRNPADTQRYDAHSGDLAAGKPIIVLINGGSASASEIVAGALQDDGRATIVGTRSFGKGSVQTIIPLGADGALRLTTALYYTPSGRSIQARGIDPDIVVQEKVPADVAQADVAAPSESSLKGHLAGGKDSGSSGSPAYVPPDPKNDDQLNYALALLRGDQVNSAFRLGPNKVAPN